MYMRVPWTYDSSMGKHIKHVLHIRLQRSNNTVLCVGRCKRMSFRTFPSEVCMLCLFFTWLCRFRYVLLVRRHVADIVWIFSTRLDSSVPFVLPWWHTEAPYNCMQYRPPVPYPGHECVCVHVCVRLCMCVCVRETAYLVAVCAQHLFEFAYTIAERVCYTRACVAAPYEIRQIQAAFS